MGYVVTDHLYSNPYPDDPCGGPFRSAGGVKEHPNYDNNTFNEDGDIAQAIALSLQCNSTSSHSETNRDIRANHSSSSSSNQASSVIVIDEDVPSISDTTNNSNDQGFSIKEV